MKKLYWLSACAMFGMAACDGTLTGIGRVPRAPEPELPPAPVETAGADPSESVVPVAVAEPEKQEISAQHLLVMYEGSKSAPRTIKRSRDDARLRATEALEAIKRGQEFERVVAIYTDEPGGARRKGSLGKFTRDRMVKQFSDAAFKLDVGEVSAVVESPFGFHVIRRTE